MNRSFYNIKDYDIWLDFDKQGNFVDWNCTCLFGSVYRFTEKHIKAHTLCKHVKLALKLNEEKKKINKKKEDKE